MPATVDKDEEACRNKAREKLASATSGVEKLRYQCLARGSNGIKGLGRVFRIADDNGDKAIDLYEFGKLLQDYGLEVSECETKQMFNDFDIDGSGKLCFDEFLAALRPPMSEARRNIIKQCFDVMDVTGDGVINMDDLKKTYKAREHPKYKNGEWTEQQVFQHFMKSFGDSDADGQITMEEYLNYYSGVSLSIDSDVYFDLMMRNCYKLSGKKK